MNRIRRFAPLIILAGVIALIFGMGWNRYLSLETLRVHGGALTAFAQDNYVLCLLALMAVFAILTASVVPGVFFVTITAGYLFGPWVGGVSTSIAATIGALIVYAVARSALGADLRRKAERDQGMLKKVCAAAALAIGAGIARGSAVAAFPVDPDIGREFAGDFVPEA